MQPVSINSMHFREFKAFVFLSRSSVNFQIITKLSNQLRIIRILIHIPILNGLFYNLR